MDAFDPRAFRLLVLRAHYRSPIDIAEDSMRDAEAAVARLDSFARRFSEARGAEADRTYIERFRAAMDDDLNTPAAVATMFDAVRRANTEGDVGAAAAALEIAAVLGLELSADVGEVPDEVLTRARARDEARAAKDWATADRIRDELVAEGWVVEDTTEGTVVRQG